MGSDLSDFPMWRGECRFAISFKRRLGEAEPGHLIYANA
jgi:hypothetical protein